MKFRLWYVVVSSIWTTLYNVSRAIMQCWLYGFPDERTSCLIFLFCAGLSSHVVAVILPRKFKKLFYFYMWNTWFPLHMHDSFSNSHSLSCFLLHYICLSFLENLLSIKWFGKYSTMTIMLKHFPVNFPLICHVMFA